MHRPTLNLGILAHIDAGKTSLSERLLYDHGAITRLGSVDAGSTTTDSSELERQRGITIRSAVASFVSGDVQINLVDTPGHPDFIAEVERALSVLDAAVLVVSAVEGVQAQTRVLFRSLHEMRVPTVLFVNKIDRAGARYETVLEQVRRRLTARIAPLAEVREQGTAAAQSIRLDLDRPDVAERLAETLAENDDAVLAQLLDGETLDQSTLHSTLRQQVMAGDVVPVLAGSALSGAGAAELVQLVSTLVPPVTAAGDADPRGVVFAVDRTRTGERVCHLRLFAGAIEERQRLTFHRSEPGSAGATFEGRVSRLDVAGDQGARRLTAGGIAAVHGIAQLRIGDRLGDPNKHSVADVFAQPRLESVVRPADSDHPAAHTRLHAALTALADEDPLIRTRVTADGQTSVLLYGPVQREVIHDRLALEFGIEAEFEPIRPVYRERPVGTGEAVAELDRLHGSTFWATIGLRVEPARAGSGVRYVRDVEWGSVPKAFHLATEEAVREALRHGQFGWEVVDCVVTVIRFGYLQPMSVAADFRQLAPIVLRQALGRAGTQVHEPYQRVEVRVPADTTGVVLARLGALHASIHEVAEAPGAEDEWAVHAELPTRMVQDLSIALPGLTRGEGVVFSRPGEDRPAEESFRSTERR